MILKARKIPIKVGQKYILVLNERTAHMLDVHAGDRLAVQNGSKRITCIVDITENGDIKDNEAGLYVETWNTLKADYGDKMFVTLAEKPAANMFIRQKLDGKELTREEIDTIVKNIVSDDLSDVEMTYFVSACYINGLSDRETTDLTKSIVEHGNRIKLNKKIVADKHCIGGVPGNRTTMVVIPIIAAAGIPIPKTSSRAITSPSGTADTMEVMCNVTNNATKLKQILNKVGAFISWGGGVDLAAADDKLIRVRHPMSLDPKGMMLASIMAKKYAVGSTHVLIDIPYGPQVKTKTLEQANELKKDFERLGRMLGMTVKVIATRGDAPIGRGIGPVLEAVDVMDVLANKPTAPQDLRKKAIFMAGELLELCGKSKKGEGAVLAEKLLNSGAALKKMNDIIDAQGRKKMPKVGKFIFNIVAKKSGKIVAIDNKLVSHVARVAGAPKNVGAGVTIEKNLGDIVKKGDTLYTIYAENAGRLKNAIEESSQAVYIIK